MFAFTLPDIGEGMHEGEIQKWLVQVGDEVKADQPIVEVQTDKVTAELPAPVDGHVQQILVEEGQTVTVGTVIILIEDASGSELEDSPQVTPEAATVSTKREQSDWPSASALKPTTQSSRNRVLATPHIRSLARRMGVDIERVTGTGRGGRVTELDLEAVVAGQTSLHRTHEGTVTASQPIAEVAKTESPREERMALRGIRKQIALHMVKSVSTIPHVTHVDEIELDELQAMRIKLKDHAGQQQIKLTLLPFFVKALVIALKEFPMLNASLDDEREEIVLKHYYNIGIATDTNSGLMVPVIKDADRKTVLEIAKEVGDLAGSAREGKLTRDQVTGGTFTISNVGAIGGLYATPIINHPEAAILGMHKIEQRTVVRGGESVIRLMMHMSLSFDHRMIDGAMAVRFTNRIKSLLEEPAQLLLAMV